jgi:predicted lactoylglutathione lyase
MFLVVAPILPVRDIEAAAAFYARLGFEVRRYGQRRTASPPATRSNCTSGR